VQAAASVEPAWHTRYESPVDPRLSVYDPVFSTVAITPEPRQMSTGETAQALHDSATFVFPPLFVWVWATRSSSGAAGRSPPPPPPPPPEPALQTGSAA